MVDDDEHPSLDGELVHRRAVGFAVLLLDALEHRVQVRLRHGVLRLDACQVEHPALHLHREVHHLGWQLHLGRLRPLALELVLLVLLVLVLLRFVLVRACDEAVQVVALVRVLRAILVVEPPAAAAAPLLALAPAARLLH